MAGRYIYTTCMQCLTDAQKKNLWLVNYTFTHYRLKHHYEQPLTFTCANGHNMVVVLQEHKFESLFEIALEDFIAGRYREAVFNFASSFERFLEFASRLLLWESGVRENEMTAWWNKVKKSSERQFGAFSTLFLSRFKAVPPFFEKIESMASVRNKVIHNGEDISYDEAYKYAQFIVSNINSVMKFLLENLSREKVLEFNRYEYSLKILDKYSNMTHMFCSSSKISWTTLTKSEQERDKKLADYCRKNPWEYAAMALEVNKTGEVLDVNDQGSLCLVDIGDLQADKPVEYMAPTFDNLLKSVSDMQLHFNAIRNNCVDFNRIVDIE